MIRKDPEDFIQVLHDEKPLYFQFFDRHVRELTAIALDLDIYKLDEPLDPTMALLIVLGKALRGQIPIPTLLAKSGRGVYIWYLLREEVDDCPPILDEKNKHLWTLAINELLNCTADLNSDRNATRLAQWLKFPGTTDTKTGNEVIYLTPGIGGPQNLPIYTLPGLIDHLGLASADVVDHYGHFPTIKKRDPRPKTSKSAVSANPYLSRRRDLERLAVHRKGIEEGYRNATLYYYFSAVVCNKTLSHNLC